MADIMKPSEVFARRLRDTRKACGLTQTALAQRATDEGRELDRAAALRIESGERGWRSMRPSPLHGFSKQSPRSYLPHPMTPWSA
jgi:hypothetical protein